MRNSYIFLKFKKDIALFLAWKGKSYESIVYEDKAGIAACTFDVAAHGHFNDGIGSL